MVKMRPFAAFIRAIGPESHKVMPQLKLCAACTVAGLHDVKSYIASGNLYFRSTKSAERSSAIVAKAIAGFGIDRDVFVRSLGELDDVISRNPFANAEAERPQLLVAQFFDHAFDENLVNELISYVGQERISVSTGVVYVDYAEGIGLSKIHPGVIEKHLKMRGTARNWNTILKMRKLLGQF